jgi:hypothetical protein
VNRFRDQGEVAYQPDDALSRAPTRPPSDMVDF